MTAHTESGGHLSVVEVNPDAEPKSEKWLRLLGVSALSGFMAQHGDKVYNLSRFDEICGDKVEGFMTVIEVWDNMEDHPNDPDVIDANLGVSQTDVSEFRGLMRSAALKYAHLTEQGYEDMVLAHDQLMVMAGDEV